LLLRIAEGNKNWIFVLKRGAKRCFVAFGSNGKIIFGPRKQTGSALLKTFATVYNVMLDITAVHLDIRMAAIMFFIF
jgi:hypothetical protein